MDDRDKTKVQLVTELAQLRQRIAELAVTETEHNQVKEALQTSETQYRRLFEAAKDGILILDAVTGEITAVNPFLTNLLGYSQKEMLGRKLWKIGTGGRFFR
jgi:PAS domain-containing protein